MKRALAPLLLLLALPLHAAKIPVSGRVVDPDGKPVPNAKVALIAFPPEAERGRLEIAGQTGPEPAVTVSSNAEGVYRLEAPDSGIWRVKVEAPGFVPLQVLLEPLVEETDLPEVKLLRDAGLKVKVTDAQGKPVAGARVRVMDERRAPSALVAWQTAVRLAATDANGSATLPWAAEERVLVQAGAPGQPFAEQREIRSGSVSLRLAAGKSRRLQVRDPQGKGVPDVLVILAGSSWRVGRTPESGLLDIVLPDAQGTRLRLVAEDGRGLAFSLPAAKPEDQGPVAITLPPASTVTSKVVSGQDGRALPGAVVWRGDDPGVAVRAGADGAFRIPATAETKGVSAAAAGFFTGDTTIEEGRAATLRLEPRLAAAGMVVDEGGRPVPGAEILATYVFSPALLNRMSAYQSGGVARSNESGRFRLISLAPDIAYQLKVRKTGFAPAKVELPAREAGQPAQDLRIVLRAGRTAFGLVIDGQRRPVAGARVTLQPATPSSFAARRLASRNPSERFEGTTDPAGRFEVASLPAGTYDATVRGKGFAPLTVPGLVLPEGAGRTDLGTVVLSPGTAVRGIVADLEGKPVEGAEVRAQAAAERSPFPRAFSSREPEPADAVTAQDGTFLLADRAPGESLDLTVTHPSYGTESAPGVAVPREEPVRVVLKPVARVSGRVLDPDGKPIPEAQVFLIEMRSESFGGGQSSLLPARLPRDAKTDEKGAFEIERVAPGPIQVNAQAPRRQRARVEGLEVKPGRDLTNVEIVLAPGGTVEGRVLSPEGRPVPNAQVSVAETASQGMMVFSSVQTKTDGDGRYRLDGVPPGPRTLEATAEGYRRGVRDVEVTAETRTVDFELERGLEVAGRVVDDAGNPIPSVQVVLTAGRNFFDALRAITGADGGFRISGVQDGTYNLTAIKDGYAADFQGHTVAVAGASIGGLEIKLSAGASITGRITGVEFSQLARVRVWANWEGNSGRVDPDGVYRISNLRPGTWRVAAEVPGTPLHAEGQVTIEPGNPEARLDLQLGQGYELTGLVLRNGQPLAGATVGLHRPGTLSEQNAKTDHQGSFRFGGLESGAYDLAVSTPNGAQHRESVEISGDREIRVELRTASLTGRVVDAADSSPLSGVQVSLAPLAPEDGRAPFFPEVTTDARGTFRLLEVGDGAWKVKASREGYAPGEREIQVDGSADGGENQEVEIRLSPTAGLTVEAVLASGQRPDRVQVTVIGGDGRVVSSGSYPLGEEGRARISNVPPGSWQLLVESNQSAAATVAATVPGPVLHVVLPPAGRVEIRVPDLAQSNVIAKATLTGPGGPLRFTGFGGTVESEWNLYQGRAFLSHIPAGSWQVVVRAPDGRSWTATATVTPGGLEEITMN